MFMLKLLWNAVMCIAVFLAGLWVWQHVICSDVLRGCVLKW